MKPSLRLLWRVVPLIPEPYQLIRPELILEKPPSYSTLVPITGKELFGKLATFDGNRTCDRMYKLLLDAQKYIFDDPAPEINQHIRRISQGYLEAINSKNEANPYYDTWLYPWEIIKDKLRMQWNIGLDIYDHLIEEAIHLNKHAIRPQRIFQSDNVAMGMRELDRRTLNRRFAKLPVEKRIEYEHRSALKLQYYKQLDEYRMGRRLPVTTYGTFYRSFFDQNRDKFQGVPINEIGRAIAKEWRALSDEEKSQYKGMHYTVRGRFNQERALERKTQLVMDYIFESGQVENWSGDWRTWRQEVAGNMYYVKKMYFPYLVQTRNQKQIIFKGPPSREEEDIDTWRTENQKLIYEEE